MESESQLQGTMIKWLESKGWYVVKVITANKSGVPDILFCRDGLFCAIEVKKEGRLSKVSELQKLHLEMINASGGKAIVADNLETVKNTFK
jgi:Holliday junction resolvase